MVLGGEGSRSWRRRNAGWAWLYIVAMQADIDKIVSCGAIGPDTFAVQWANANKIPTNTHLPDWNPNGVFDPCAGHDRNAFIVDDCDVILAFWDGKSEGTRDTMNQAKKAGKKVYYVLADDVFRRWV